MITSDTRCHWPDCSEAGTEVVETCYGDVLVCPEHREAYARLGPDTPSKRKGGWW